jgi:protein-tyrosine phosphatase
MTFIGLFLVFVQSYNFFLKALCSALPKACFFCYFDFSSYNLCVIFLAVRCVFSIFAVAKFQCRNVIKNRLLLAMTRILFVCLGNICRSPAADGIMHRLVSLQGCSDEFVIDSAGIGSWHVGQLPDRRMRRHGERHGYCFDHRARQFSAADFDRFDLIAVMDAENYHDVSRQARSDADRRKIIRLSDFLTRHPGQTTIPDPYYGGDRDFEYVIELLEDACAALLQQLTKK